MNATAATASKRPRTKPAETRREELMDAAQTLFLSQGYDETSVDQIVREADVAKGTFYFYFKMKGDVLQALRERFVEKFHERLENAVACCPDDAWTDRLDAWVEAAVDGYLDEFALHDLVFHEFRPSSRRVEHNPIIAHLTMLIAGGAKHGAWAVRDSRMTAAMLFNAFHGAVDEAILSLPKVSRNRLQAEVQAFCRKALGLPLSQ